MYETVQERAATYLKDTTIFRSTFVFYWYREDLKRDQSNFYIRYTALICILPKRHSIQFDLSAVVLRILVFDFAGI